MVPARLACQSKTTPTWALQPYRPALEWALGTQAALQFFSEINPLCNATWKVFIDLNFACTCTKLRAYNDRAKTPNALKMFNEILYAVKSE